MAMNPTLKLAPESDTGVLATDGITNDTTPIIVGFATAGSTVQLFDENQRLLGTVVASSDGSFNITSAPLGTGPHTLTVVATDPFGTASQSAAALQILIDTAADKVTSTALLAQNVGGNLTFQLHFTEPLPTGTTLKATDLKVVGTGTAVADIQSVAGKDSDFTVTLDGVAGVGTLSLDLADNSKLESLAGNPVTFVRSDTFKVGGAAGPQTLLVSSSQTGQALPGSDPSASATGRFVAFDSTFHNNGVSDIYVKDVVTGGLTNITASLDGDPDESFTLPSLSADGSVITFVSLTRSLLPGQNTTFQANVYVAHLQPADPASGDSVTLTGPIALVSSGNGNTGSSYEFQSASSAIPEAAVL